MLRQNAFQFVVWQHSPSQDQHRFSLAAMTRLDEKTTHTLMIQGVDRVEILFYYIFETTWFALSFPRTNDNSGSWLET